MIKTGSILGGFAVSVCFSYLLLYYVVPFALGYLYDYSYLDFYRGQPNFIYVLPSVCLYFICFLLVYKCMPEVITPLKRISIRSFSLPLLNFAITNIFLYLSIKFYYEYGLTYRQVGSALSESKDYVIFLTVLKLYFTTFIFCRIADLSYGLKLKLTDAITLILGALSFYFASSAAFDMLKIVVAALLVYGYLTKTNLFIAPLNRPPFLQRFIYGIVYWALLSCVFLAILFFGLANKMGYSGAYEAIFGGTFLDFIVVPLARLSVHFYTFAFHLSYNISNFEFQFATLPNVVDNLLFRFSHLIGLEYQKPEVASSARLNSLSIYYDPRDRNGATPGLLGSIFFIPFFPLSLFISLLYVSFIFKKIEQIFNNQNKASLLTVFFTVSMIQAFTDAQIDILNFVGVSGVSLVLLYLAWFDRPELRMKSLSKKAGIVR